MKKTAGVLAILAMFFLPACEQTPSGGDFSTGPVQPSGTIDGEFSLDPSIEGSVANVLVALYKSEADLQARTPLMTVRTNAQGRYVIQGVCCGQYWIDALKDNNEDGAVTSGDYYLAHKDGNGCPCACTVDQHAASFGGMLEVVR